MARDFPDPKVARYLPGDDPVPEDQWIDEYPADSADWMSDEGRQGYAVPLFDGPDVEPDDDEDDGAA